MSRRILFFLAFLLVQLGQVHAQPVPHIPRPQGLGIHCPLLLSCPATDDTALHVYWQIHLSQPRGATNLQDFAVGGALSASVTLARWLELGGIFTMHWSHGLGRLSGPLTLWARLTPPFLRGLLSSDKKQGLTLGAEARQHITTGALNAGGRLFPDAQSLSLLAEYRKWRFLALGQAGADFGDGATYRGGHAGAGLWLYVYQGSDVTLRVGGEAFAQIPQIGAGWGGPQLSLTAGLQMWEQRWGIAAGGGFRYHGAQDELAWSVVIHNGFSYGGPHETSPDPLPFLEGVNDWLKEVMQRPWLPTLWQEPLVNALEPGRPRLETPLEPWLQEGRADVHRLLAASPWEEKDPAGPRLNHPRPRGWGLLGPKGEGDAQHLPPPAPKGPLPPQVLQVPETPPATPPPRMPPVRVIPSEVAPAPAGQALAVSSTRPGAPAPPQAQPAPQAPAEHLVPAAPARGSNNPTTNATSRRGTFLHADRPGRLPDQLRDQYNETQLRFAKSGEARQDVEVIGGKHPSQYPGSTWPPGVNFGDFKPDTSGGRKTFERDQRTKWTQPTVMLPYDPVTGKLK